MIYYAGGDFDYIILTMCDKRLQEEAIEILLFKGYPRENIILGRVFENAFFNFDVYIEIKKSRVSIVSDTCLAGYVYHDWGLQFTSPTINMFAANSEYYKFIKNIEENICLPMNKYSDNLEEFYPDWYAYPRGIIGDSIWEFNHDSTFETAQERWNKGAARFNRDNYIVIMTLMSEEMAYKFDALPIKYKIGFYWKETGLDSVICLPRWREDPEFRMRFKFSFSSYVNQAARQADEGVRSVNWIKLLLHEEGYIRVEK